MKNKYTSPEMKIVAVSTEDIMLASGLMGYVENDVIFEDNSVQEYLVDSSFWS